MIATHAFLFNADEARNPTSYGISLDSAFLSALSASDPGGKTHSCVMRGDILLGPLCEKVTAVSREPKRSSHTVSHDGALYRTIIWDLADALESQWGTLDLHAFPLILGRHRVYCVTVAHLAAALRVAIDNRLRTSAGYLGAVEVDIGNPIQKSLFVDFLIPDAVITNGTVVLELSLEGYEETDFNGASQFLPNGTTRVPEGELISLHSPLPSRPLSNHGRISEERYDGKRSFTVYDRVLTALSRLRSKLEEPATFSFNQSEASGAILEADLPENKFVQYLLNPDHKDGTGKAKFFKEELGIEADDWRYLAAQFHEGLRTTDFTKLKVKEWDGGFGASFNCVLPVVGRNNRVAMIETNWIAKPGVLPQLSTAFPAAPKSNVDLEQDRSKILPVPLLGDARWEALYALADENGGAAASMCVPTPVRRVGSRVEMEGAIGAALVRVPDARKEFARWLVRSGKGSRHPLSGAFIYVMWRTRSHDRAVAYAKAFAEILALNGVKCSVQSCLDEL